MTTYRHPDGITWKTGDKPVQVHICTLEDEKMYVAQYAEVDQLLALGFKEVVEEKEKDWIDVVGDNFLEELYATKNIKFKELTKYCLRQQIEKHMPKTERTINKYFDEFVAKNHKILSSESIERFVQFLKDNGVR